MQEENVSCVRVSFVCLSFIHLVCYLYWSGVDIIREEAAEHAAPAGPYGPVMDLGAARQGRQGSRRWTAGGEEQRGLRVRGGATSP